MNISQLSQYQSVCLLPGFSTQAERDAFSCKWIETGIIGTPGSGKTTELCKKYRDRQVRGDIVCAITFTKAAEINLNMRLGGHSARTIHSIAFGMNGKGKDIFEVEIPRQSNAAVERRYDKKFRNWITLWNYEYPEFATSFEDDDPAVMYEDDFTKSVEVEVDYLKQYNHDRATLTSLPLTSTEELPEFDTEEFDKLDKYVQFIALYEDFKESNNVMDFTDMIVNALGTSMIRPEKVWFVDEAQDCSPLEWRFIEMMAFYNDIKELIYVGDADQSIYQFKGGRPELLTEREPTHGWEFLRESYRCPEAVVNEAIRIASQIPNRDDLGGEMSGEYFKSVTGTVGSVTDTKMLMNSEMVISQIEEMSHSNFMDNLAYHANDPDAKPLQNQIAILSHSKYMYRPLLAELRERGIPVHNPYSERSWEVNGWHYINKSSRFQLPAEKWSCIWRGEIEKQTYQKVAWPLSAVYNFVFGDALTFKTLATMFEATGGWGGIVLRAGCDKSARDDYRKMLIQHDPEDVIIWNNVPRLLEMTSATFLSIVADKDLHRLHDAIFAAKYWDGKDPYWKDNLLYCIRIALRDSALLEYPPNVIVSTVHSIKGGEARQVFLCNEKTKREEGFFESRNVVGIGEFCRKQYVGATRAQEDLFYVRYE